MKACIGIDLSINSTGIVFNLRLDNDESVVKFIQICPHVAKTSGSVQLVTYKRQVKSDNYSESDINTVIDAAALATCISKQITKFSEIYGFTEIDAVIEGSVMASRFSKATANLNQLTVFNGTVKRMLVMNKFVKSISVIAPSSLKKSFTGKGNCKKEKMIERFIELFPDFDIRGKIDDVVDAYALSVVNSSESTKWHKVA